MIKHTKEDKTVLLAAIAIVMKDGKPISLSEYAGATEGEAFKAKRKEYNAAKDVYHAAMNASKDDRTEKQRHRASLINPTKHRMVASAGFAEGSIMDSLCEDERAAKGKAFADARHGHLIPSQVGLSDAEFCTLAKAGNWIDRSFRKENSKGSLTFTAESNKEWLAKWTLDCLAFHAVKDEQAAVPTVKEKPAKSKAA